jgi:hypothetical protein
VGICKPITILTFYYVGPRLATILKLIYAFAQVSNIFVLSVYSTSLILSSRFSFFYPESSTSFTSYIVHIISNHLVCILQPLQFGLLPLSNAPLTI